MEWTDTALVLRVGRFRETDLWIRLLTRQRGLVSAFAFGGSRSRRRFPGCLDVLNVIHVRAKDTRGGAYLNLEEGTLLEGPRRLRSDWRRLGLLMNCVRFLEALGVGPDSAEGAFALARALLTLGEEAEHIRDGLPVLFRLRLASEQGYVPDFSACGECGTPMAEQIGASGRGWFQMNNGLLRCAPCRMESPGSADIALSADVLHALRIVQQTPPVEWNALELSPGDWRECLRFADSFVQFHLGLNWENGRFRRQ